MPIILCDVTIVLFTILPRSSISTSNILQFCQTIFSSQLHLAEITRFQISAWLGQWYIQRVLVGCNTTPIRVRLDNGHVLGIHAYPADLFQREPLPSLMFRCDPDFSLHILSAIGYSTVYYCACHFIVDISYILKCWKGCREFPQISTALCASTSRLTFKLKTKIFQ